MTVRAVQHRSQQRGIQDIYRNDYLCLKTTGISVCNGTLDARYVQLNDKTLYVHTNHASGCITTKEELESKGIVDRDCFCCLTHRHTGHTPGIMLFNSHRSQICFTGTMSSLR
ncbi:hypothetical protein TNCV_2974861 [Trichonephila clavipes]|nr:hypothetical protein TNCV_2974861 [Trichonephila clavipes]